MADSFRTAEYIRSLDLHISPELAALRERAEEDGVPVIRPETESLITTLLKLKAPGSILELGTAVGYSAIVMARACDASVTTVENYEKRYTEACRNIETAGLRGRIDTVFGDAGELLKRLRAENRSFDAVFLDAAKGQYLSWLEDIIAVLEPGGLLIADNVLQEGNVAESRFTVARRDRTAYERMRSFLRCIKNNDSLSSAVIPVGDGVSISVKTI